MVSFLALTTKVGAGSIRVWILLINICINSLKSSIFEILATGPIVGAEARSAKPRVGVYWIGITRP